MKTGKIITFNVTACCPYCDEDTDLRPDELARSEAECMHCNETFSVDANDY